MEIPKEIEESLKKHDVLLKTMKGYYEIGAPGIKTNSSKQKLKGQELYELVVGDPLVRACYEIIVASIFKNGFEVKNIGKKQENILKKLRFERFLRKYTWQLLLYQTSFTEIVKDGNGNPKKLAVYTSPEFEIVHDKKGDITGFLQIPKSTMNNKQPQIIDFTPDEIFYSSFNEMDSSVWGHATLLTLVDVVKSKHLIENFITWLFESNQFRTVIKIPDDYNEKAIKQQIQLLINSMNDPKKFLLLQGETAEHKPLREIAGFQELLLLLDYYRSQILALLQLPPLQVGILNSSNRSNAEYQVRYSFYTKIKHIQDLIEDEIEMELFPRIGLKDAELEFNPLDDKSVNDYLDMATKLINMGADPQKVNSWLSERIPELPEDLFDHIDVNNPDVNIFKPKLDKNSNLHPSRQESNMDFASGIDVTKQKEDKKKNNME